MNKVVGWKSKIELSWEDGTTEIIEDRDFFAVFFIFMLDKY